MTPPRIRDYRDLLVWQKAMDLALTCERITTQLPPKAYKVGDQIRRAALSVPANIAEGNARFSRPDYVRYLSIANGSLKELESHLHFARRAYGETQAINEALDAGVHVTRLLAGLVRSLRGRQK